MSSSSKYTQPFMSAAGGICLQHHTLSFGPIKSRLVRRPTQSLILDFRGIDVVEEQFVFDRDTPGRRVPRPS